MSEQLGKKIFAKTDWRSYNVFRPEYPPSLIDLITSYHRSKGGRFQLAHDAGSGNGTFAVHLAPYFPRIHVSDPSATNIAEAHASLTDESIYTFSTTPAEEAHTVLPEGTVHLLTIAEAAHWVDLTLTIPSIARSLAPGGTLAIIYYDVLPHLLDVSPELQNAWNNLVKRAYAHSLALLTRIGHQIATRTNAGVCGNDYIPLPEDVFDTSKTRRMNFNVRGDAPGAFRIPDDAVPVEGVNRVGPGEVVEEWNSPDEVARGWQIEVGPGWLKGAFMTMPPVRDRIEEYEAELEIVDGMIEREAGQRVIGEFPVAVLLATRR